MSLLSRRLLRCAGVWLLLALLAVPLVVSGHCHEPLHAKADSCALCAAVGSISVAAVQAAPQLTVVLEASAHHALARRAPRERTTVASPARAPPLALLSSLA